MFWFVVVCCEKTLGFFVLFNPSAAPPGARGPSPAGGGGGGGACAWVPDPNAEQQTDSHLPPVVLQQQALQDL